MSDTFSMLQRYYECSGSLVIDMGVTELAESCKKQHQFRVRFYKADHVMEAMKMHELEHNFMLCLLQPTSRQFSQGQSHSLLPLSLCFFCCVLPGYTVSCLCKRKQTESKKEMIPRQSAR